MIGSDNTPCRLARGFDLNGAQKHSPLYVAIAVTSLVLPLRLPPGGKEPIDLKTVKELGLAVRLVIEY
jgi:hypothetical protein